MSGHWRRGLCRPQTNKTSNWIQLDDSAKVGWAGNCTCTRAVTSWVISLNIKCLPWGKRNVQIVDLTMEWGLYRVKLTAFRDDKPVLWDFNWVRSVSNRAIRKRLLTIRNEQVSCAQWVRDHPSHWLSRQTKKS